MNSILSEKDLQKMISQHLIKHNGYVERTTKHFNVAYAMDIDLLFEFLYSTQPKQMRDLEKIYKENTRETILNFINNKIVNSSLIEVLKNDYIEISGINLKLMYIKPSSTLNKEAVEKYNKNIFSVIEEVYADTDNKERIDLVIFLNGFAIITIELKCNTSGQNFEDAIEQYKTTRNPKNRLLMPKCGALVHFAMDLEEVHMTTKLEKEKTVFIPFNKGCGEGIECGAGNPICEDKFSTAYMWEEILCKDALMDIICNFITMDRKTTIDELTGKQKREESVIFPRYHQYDAIKKIVLDILSSEKLLNYLIQHSCGSGKTKTITWLAYCLVSLHNELNKIIYDTVIIISDRLVIDRQLQKSIQSISHKSGLVKVLDETCNANDLKKALESNTKIIVTTIQKFRYVLDTIKQLNDRKFACIIDEAHSSTAGKNMSAVNQALGMEENDATDIQEKITNEIVSKGKPDNVSFFAFTGTPKPTTLRMFGRLNKKGEYEAFHLYSMKQAIEEGFVLDPLLNYTTYETMYSIQKTIADNPWLSTKNAKKQIAQVVALHETNINQRVAIIMNHFLEKVLPQLNGQGKAMIVNTSRQEAYLYQKAIKHYIKRKGIKDVNVVVAFSGKITDKETGIEHSESIINGFSERKTAEKFDTNEYNVMVVANKYQTGFDQPKLCAMYILKKLDGINAVQTLLRLNRPCFPFDKQVFVLDFVNEIADIENAFKPFYCGTVLCNDFTPEQIYELATNVESYNLFDCEVVDDFCKTFYDTTISASTKKVRLVKQLSTVKKKWKNLLSTEDKQEYVASIKRFIRFYDFMLQVSSFYDEELYKKSLFMKSLLPLLKLSGTGSSINIIDKIKVENFIQKKKEERKNKQIKSSPRTYLPTTDMFHLSCDAKKRLSDIIAEINAKTGKSFNDDVATKAALQIKDLMLKNKDLRTSAKNNTMDDFSFTYFDNIDDALLDGRTQNQDFFDLLLKNQELRNEVLGIFLEEIYNSLRES